MRILVLTTTFPRWKNDTTPAFVYELSKNLQKKDTKVVVLAPHHNGSKKFEIMDGMKVYRFPYFFPLNLQKLAYEGGILPNLERCHLAKIQIPLLFLSEMYHTFRIIKKEKIDVIHSHWIVPSGLIGAIYMKFFKIKHVTTAHAGDVFTIRNFKILKKIGSFILRNSNIITVNSNYTKKEILNIENQIENKVKIIPMGVNLSHFNPKWKNKINLKKIFNTKNLILSVGRLVKKKGIKYLIISMKYVIKQVNDCKLIICGSGPELKNLKKITNELELKEKVIFVGSVKNSELPIYYASSDVFVMPSIVTKKGDTEGLGIVLLEALASGVPVIGSNVGGISDIIRDNETGFLTRSKNPRDIAEKIITILSSKNFEKKFSINGLKMVKENFSWDIITERFIDLLKV